MGFDEAHPGNEQETQMEEDEIQLTRHGEVVIDSQGIVVRGFAGSNTTCRELAILACAWAIGELQREMTKNIERPGGGNIGVD